MQQDVPQRAALQGKASQPRGVVLPHAQPQVLRALQAARVPLLQLHKPAQMLAPRREQPPTGMQALICNGAETPF